jgi:phospholipase/carboxylesterase
MTPLGHLERSAADQPEGLLILHHGRGTDERDLLPLADVLDPEARLHAVTPRGPLTLRGAPGFHWYVVPEVGFPHQETFAASYRDLAEFHDQLWERTGVAPERTVLGGFSMGTVMSYALGLGPDRPRPAGILALSGFIPTVEGWEPDLAGRAGLPVFIGHGRNDPVISVEFARAASELLSAAGLEITYQETEAGHQIDPSLIPMAKDWVDRTIPASFEG